MRNTRLLLVLLALKQKLNRVEFGIVDYQKALAQLGHKLSYLGCRAALEKLAQEGVLSKKLIKTWVRNALLDENGNTRLERSTQVFKRVYSLNPGNQQTKRMLNFLSNLSCQLFQKDLFSSVADEQEFKKLCLKLKVDDSEGE